VLQEGQTLTHEVSSGRKIFIQVIRGNIAVNGQSLAAGDGAQLENEVELSITSLAESDFLLFDMG
jgi:redox-sensitive bicupin YhaK (pirin superfamily)